jgi:hypothetical protein
LKRYAVACLRFGLALILLAKNFTQFENRKIIQKKFEKMLDGILVLPINY